jgi:uncharacterized protein YutE (UPF0331/DUF86 family)
VVPVDQDKILQYEAEIREAEGLLAEITAGDIEEFAGNSLKIRAMKYTLIVLVEAICNICRHILAKKTHIVVGEYMDAILKMEEQGFLSKETTNKLVPLTKLRHQLIHGYWKTDNRRLFTETWESLRTIDEFISEIRQLLSSGVFN